MITVVTGTPGAGKTLYAIEKLILPLVGTDVQETDSDGNLVSHPRTIYTNINGFQVDHELIDGGDNEGLRDWQKWAKPGSVIVFDEFQKPWPPRPNGSKVPDDIQALDTHRHMGVDFILITQSVINVDKHVHALAGRHLHVRRVANMKLAVVYEWDHVSRALMYSKAISKSPWRYDKKVFKLYKSAQLHTKQPRKLPGLVWFILIGLISLVVLAPTLKMRLDERFNPKPKVAEATLPPGSVPGVQPGAVPGLPSAFDAPSFIDDRVDFVPRLSHVPESAPAYDKLRVIVNMPVIAGALCKGQKCTCYTQQGTPLSLANDECKTWMQSPAFDHYKVAPPPPPPAPLASLPPSSELTTSRPGTGGPGTSRPMPDGAINPKAESNPPPFALRLATINSSSQ